MTFPQHIVDFVQNFTGKPTRMEMRFPEETKQIKQLTSFLSEPTTTPQRFWHILNNISTCVLCAQCNSGKVRWNKTTNAYSTYCSRSCQMSSKTVQETREQRSNAAHGAKHHAQREGYQETVNRTTRIATDEQRKQASERMKDMWAVVPEDARKEWSKSKKEQFRNKYGVTSYLQTEGAVDKHRNRMIEIYASPSISGQHISTDVRSKLYDRDWLTEQHHVKKLTQQQIAELLGVNVTTVGRIMDLLDVDKKIFSGSAGQKDVVKFLRDNGVCNILENQKITGTNFEVDILLPDCNIAIEYCGIYWHSDLHPRIDPKYHQRKQQLCVERGITLITVLDLEWQQRRRAAEQLLLSTVGIRKAVKIHARQCDVRSVGFAEKVQFLNQHHIMGTDRSKHAVGLYAADSLVAVLSYTLKDGVVDVTRYATDGGYSVRGGFSRLLKHIERTTECNSVETFADLRFSTGKMYLATGFEAIKYVPPTFILVDNKTKKQLHRSNYMKSKIIARYPELSALGTEREMHTHLGLLRFWDCGKIKLVKASK